MFHHLFSLFQMHPSFVVFQQAFEYFELQRLGDQLTPIFLFRNNVLIFQFTVVFCSVCSSDGSGSKFFDPGRVSHLWFGLEFRKFPQKTSNFSILFPSGQKKLLWVGSESTRVKAASASYLLRVKHKLGSGQGPSLVCTLFSLHIF